VNVDSKRKGKKQLCNYHCQGRHGIEYKKNCSWWWRLFKHGI